MDIRRSRLRFRGTALCLGLYALVSLAPGCTNKAATSNAFHAIDAAVEKLDPTRLGTVVSDRRSGTVQLSSDSPTRIIDVQGHGADARSIVDNAISQIQASGFVRRGAQGWQATIDGALVIVYVGADPSHTDPSVGKYAVGFRFVSQG